PRSLQSICKFRSLYFSRNCHCGLRFSRSYWDGNRIESSFWVADGLGRYNYGIGYFFTSFPFEQGNAKYGSFYYWFDFYYWWFFFGLEVARIGRYGCAYGWFHSFTS